MMDRSYAAEYKRLSMKRDGPYVSSDGVVDEYLDGIEMLLRAPEAWREYYERRLRVGNQALWPIAQGRAGAVVLGLLGRGTLWNAGKGYGLEWANEPDGPGRLIVGVALVDDCRFTGKSMVELRAAVSARWPELQIVREIVGFPYMPLGSYA